MEEGFLRDHHRFKVDGTVVIVFPDNKRKGAFVKDVSARGIGTIAAYRLKLHEKVHLIISIPALGDSIERDATVVSCKERQDQSWDIGFAFGLDNKINLPFKE